MDRGQWGEAETRHRILPDRQETGEFQKTEGGEGDGEIHRDTPRKGWAHRKEKEVGQSQREVRETHEIGDSKMEKDTSRRQRPAGMGPTVGGEDEAQGKGERHGNRVREQSRSPWTEAGEQGRRPARSPGGGVRSQVRAKPDPQEPSSWGPGGHG